MSHSNPVISVLIPLYNSSRHVEGALNSLCEQSYGNWQAIVVNDGSTDDTVTKVQPFLADPRFQYLEQSNAGVAAARNAALRTATGTWICLLDHDDRWMPIKLEKQLAFAAAHDLDILGTGAIAVQGMTRKPYSEFYDPAYIASLEQGVGDPTADMFGLLIRHNFLVASSVMLRKSHFENHGPFDMRLAPAEDYDMWLKCMPDGRLGYLSEPLVEYRIHDGNASHNFIVLLERTIKVLHSAAERNRHDSRRVRQFGDSLIVAYQTLFAELLERRQYTLLGRHLTSLAAKGQRGLRLLRWLITGDLLRLLWRSRHSSGKARRSNFGKHGLNPDQHDPV